jgi:WD40 repeat protein
MKNNTLNFYHFNFFYLIFQKSEIFIFLLKINLFHKKPENRSEEIEDLVEMLKDLQARCSAEEFNNIMTCLQSPSITDHPEYRNWTPLSGRLKCFEKLRKHLEHIYPISKGEVKVEPGSFTNLVLNAVQNNPNYASLNKKNYNDNSNENNLMEISLLNLINNDNNKGRKIYNANKNRILIEDDLKIDNKFDKTYKDENEAFMRKSNNSLKAIRNERISQSLNLNKIAEIYQENLAEDEKAQNNFMDNNNNEEFSNQLYEVCESNQKRNQAGKINSDPKCNNIKVNEIYKSEENEFEYENAGNKKIYKNNNLPLNSKANQQYKNNINKNYNFYNNEINVIEEEERSKKDEEIDLDDIDEKMELNQNNPYRANNNNHNNNYNNNNNFKSNYNQNAEYYEIIKNQNSLKNKSNLKFSDENYIEDDNFHKLKIVEDDENNNNIDNNYNKSIDDNALSDLDKEEYFMKSCYDFFEYDIATLAERKVIEDSHPIRTSCFSSKGDYFAIGTNSKSIKLFHIKPVLQRFNKKNSYNFKSDFHHNSNANNLLYTNNLKSNSLYNNANYNLNHNNEIDDIKMVFEQTNHHMGSIYCLDWSLSGRLIASGSNDRLIKLMVVPNLDESLYGKDYETLELVINGHEGTVRSVCFEPTNDLILLSGGICIINYTMILKNFFVKLI